MRLIDLEKIFFSFFLKKEYNIFLFLFVKQLFRFNVGVDNQ